MTEPSQVDLNRYSFRLVLGRTDSGAVWPLALHESHGIIASGSDAEALRALASAQLESLFHQECIGNAELIWPGQTLPAWAEGRKDVTVVSEPDEIFSQLETFVEEQNRRFDLMHEAGSNNLPHYNAASASAGRDLLPFRMFFIEDLPGTVSRLGHTFLDKLCYAARYGRACGMLPYVCTQNPAPEGLPALLKAEVGDRVCLRVPSLRDSVMALMAVGAETLSDGELLYRNVEEKEEAVRLHY